MAYTTQNPQFGFSLFANLFTYDNTNPFLLDLDRNWTQVWDVMNTLTGGKSVGFNDDKGVYRRPLLKRQAVIAQISTNATAVGSNLLVTFTNPNYNGFRVKDYVMDDSLNEGRVIAVSNGTITIEPLFNPTSFTAGSQFLASSFVRAYGDVSGNFNSGSKTPLYREISVQSDYSSVFRDGCQRARREKFKTHIGTDGIAYFYTNDEVEMVKRAMKYYGKEMMFSVGGTKTSTVEGQINTTRGVRQSIIQDGIYDASSSQMTQSDFENLFFAVANTDGSIQQTIEVWCGRRALARVQRFYTNLLQYAGMQSTLGGASVKGENFKSYAIADIDVNFRVMGCLNDSLEVPDWMQDSVYIMDLTPLSATNEMGQITKQSPMQKIHWSSNTNSTDEVIYKVVPGMTTPGDGSNTPAIYADYQIAANANDGYSTEMLMDFGLSYHADKAALFEYIH